MAHSRRKTPIAGITTATSEKADKRLANRVQRRLERTVVHLDPLADVMPHRRETSDPWDMPKDGKNRFDPRRFPELMRK